MKGTRDVQHLTPQMLPQLPQKFRRWDPKRPKRCPAPGAGAPKPWELAATKRQRLVGASRGGAGLQSTRERQITFQKVSKAAGERRDTDGP